VLQVLRPDSIGGYFQVHGMESASGMTSRTPCGWAAGGHWLSLRARCFPAGPLQPSV